MLDFGAMFGDGRGDGDEMRRAAMRVRITRAARDHYGLAGIGAGSNYSDAELDAMTGRRELKGLGASILDTVRDAVSGSAQGAAAPAPASEPMVRMPPGTPLNQPDISPAQAAEMEAKIARGEFVSQDDRNKLAYYRGYMRHGGVWVAPREERKKSSGADFSSLFKSLSSGSKGSSGSPSPAAAYAGSGAYSSGGSSGSALPWVLGIGAAVVAMGGIAFVIVRSR